MPRILERLQRSGLDVEQEIDPPNWGQAKLRVFQGKEGRYLLKSMGHSSFAGLPCDLLNELFDSLYECTSHLLLPVRVEGQFLLEVDDEPSMVFPWVGPWESHQPSWNLELMDHVRFVAMLDEELARTPEDLVRRLVEQMCFIQVTPSYLEQQLDRSRALIDTNLEKQLLEACAVWETRPLTTSRYTKLAHTDIHASNVVRDREDRLIAIDIDGMRVGDDFADLIHTLSYRGVDREHLEAAISLYRKLRPLCAHPFDIDTIFVGVALSLSWLVSISQRVGGIIECDMRERMSENAWNRAVVDVTRVHQHLGGTMVRSVAQMNHGLSSVLWLALKESESRTTA